MKTYRSKKDVNQPDIHLIAAAPELLEMLIHARKCIAYCRKHHKDVQTGEGIPIETLIDAAIAKTRPSRKRRVPA